MQGYDPNWFDYFAAKAVEGLHQLFEMLSIIAYFFKADRKRILVWLPLSMRILVMSHLSIWMLRTMALVCGNKARLMYWVVNVMGIRDHSVWVIGPSMTMWLTCL
jgi:hypothetical protein